MFYLNFILFSEKKGRLKQFIMVAEVFVSSIRQCYRRVDVDCGPLCSFSDVVLGDCISDCRLVLPSG